jgi:hypothetical protein
MAKPYEMIDWMLKNTTALTAIISKRSFHSNRPKTQTLPNIAYMESGGPFRQNGIENQDFVLNCRGQTVAKALDLAREVVDTFHGSAGTGIHGTVNGFDVGRSSLASPPALIAEPKGSAYNVPVVITVIYPSSTVS